MREAEAGHLSLLAWALSSPEHVQSRISSLKLQPSQLLHELPKKLPGEEINPAQPSLPSQDDYQNVSRYCQMTASGRKHQRRENHWWGVCVDVRVCELYLKGRVTEKEADTKREREISLSAD